MCAVPADQLDCDDLRRSFSSSSRRRPRRARLSPPHRFARSSFRVRTRAARTFLSFPRRFRRRFVGRGLGRFRFRLLLVRSPARASSSPGSSSAIPSDSGGSHRAARPSPSPARGDLQHAPRRAVRLGRRGVARVARRRGHLHVEVDVAQVSVVVDDGSADEALEAGSRVGLVGLSAHDRVSF